MNVMICPKMNTLPNSHIEKRAMEKLFNCYMVKTRNASEVGSFLTDDRKWNEIYTKFSPFSQLSNISWDCYDTPYDGYYYYYRKDFKYDSLLFRCVASLLVDRNVSELRNFLCYSNEELSNELEYCYSFDRCLDCYSETNDVFEDIRNCLFWLCAFLENKSYPQMRRDFMLLFYEKKISVKDYMEACVEYYVDKFSVSSEVIARIFPCLSVYMNTEGTVLDHLNDETFEELYIFESPELGRFIRWSKSTPFIMTDKLQLMLQCMETLKVPFGTDVYGVVESTLTKENVYVVAYISPSINDFMFNPTYFDAHDTFFALYREYENRCGT